MDFVSYLTTPAGAFGGLEWGFLVVEGVVALVGVYLAFLRNDAHPIRSATLRRLGMGLLLLGGLGVAFAALRLAAVDPFRMPLWFVIVGLVELVLAGYALFYWQVRYPAALAAYEQSTRGAIRRSTRPQPMLQTSGNSVAFNDPQSLATTSRRDSRRDRKRRGR
jgi:hypothetical protein